MAGKITREEPEGPLRRGCDEVAERLGQENGGQVATLARDLANDGLDLVLDCEALGLGNSDLSIPPTDPSIKATRQADKGKFISRL